MNCEFHARYGQEVRATTVIDGTAMCRDCYAGLPITPQQMLGNPPGKGRPPKQSFRTAEEKAESERKRKINYYYANRLTILQKKARQRGGHTRAI